VLIEQIFASNQLRGQLGERPPESTTLEQALLRIRIAEAELDTEASRSDLLAELEEAPTLTTVFQRRTALTNDLIRQLALQVELYSLGSPRQAIERALQLQQFLQRQVRVRDRFSELIEEVRLELLPALVDQVETLQRDVEAMATELNRAMGRSNAPKTPQQQLQHAISLVDEILRRSESYLIGSQGGLVPVTIDMDDAVMTALVQRFDLVNERGFVADDWRQIKFAADDLKSILNLRAAQSVRTRSGSNKPFDFTFDDSTTTVGATLDLPFNRRAQRNRFRQSLFDYQAALRRIMQLEDTIKLSVRRDLRTLDLGREQYINAVASAALASVRVTGAEKEMRLGTANSRDFLEAQDAYVRALSGVASLHINYIVDRLNLFLDLESLTVGENGFWDELYDERLQPEPNYQLPGYARPAYGQLHPRLKYSPQIRRLTCVPTGISMIHAPVNDQPGNGLAGPAD
jgi:Arc/MetJ family transcription regulator